MKNMTCRQMGGDCDYEIRADTSSRMTEKILAHIGEKHPDVLQKMHMMTPGERTIWEDKLHSDFHKN